MVRILVQKSRTLFSSFSRGHPSEIASILKRRGNGERKDRERLLCTTGELGRITLAASDSWQVDGCETHGLVGCPRYPQAITVFATHNSSSQHGNLQLDDRGRGANGISFLSKKQGFWESSGITIGVEARIKLAAEKLPTPFR